MHLTDLDLVFWAAGFLSHIILLFVLWLRHRARTFPLFAALIATDVVRTVVLYLVLHFDTRHSYFVTYWSLAVLDFVLQLAVVYEMFSQVFRPLGEWAQDVRNGILWLVCGSLVVASWLTWLAVPQTRYWVQTVVIRGSLFSSALMSELFVGMIALSVTAGLPWKTHVARISQGLGVYSVVDVLIEGGHSYSGLADGSKIYIVLSHLRMFTYLVCVVYWIVMLWQEAPESREMPAIMSGQLFTLRRIVDYDLRKLRSGRRR